ncbi:predicted protein [Sclerotinia sclerotiorum 1980 UF-70]|uniref:Uncharacterized protein n=1 Tax=Sclerotinia sclerotiorum (strain ATCC 18683 / 1980 / Ss-1) TaxID=665079 RepID=A7F3G1_SCLS1|nr:predicted protein [Sclerotinia sclerotiorum 1980 UF-70]EDN97282.1 predicted protein [Sclerotinia sclerotiorum 1980 UF-70]
MCQSKIGEEKDWSSLMFNSEKLSTGKEAPSRFWDDRNKKNLHSFLPSHEVDVNSLLPDISSIFVISITPHILLVEELINEPNEIVIATKFEMQIFRSAISVQGEEFFAQLLKHKFRPNGMPIQESL